MAPDAASPPVDLRRLFADKPALVRRLALAFVLERPRGVRPMPRPSAGPRAAGTVKPEASSASGSGLPGPLAPSR